VVEEGLTAAFASISTSLGMTIDGSITLSDVRGPSLSIVCEPCGRRGRYNVAKLMQQYGDAKLTDLLVTLTDCPKAHSTSVHDRCKAVYAGLAAG
jgi:hypothetical protein